VQERGKLDGTVVLSRGSSTTAAVSGGGKAEKEEEEEKQRLACPYKGVSNPVGVLEGTCGRGGDRVLTRTAWKQPGGSPVPMPLGARR
jgi:hypothetical protein